MAPDPSSDAHNLQPFTVGDWLVDPRACRLSRGATVVKLRPQLTDLLVCLARRAGDIALKDEILAEVWPGQFIAESGLSRCIAELRQFLQDDAQHPRYIETITKRGYRLMAPVTWLPAQADTAAEPVEPVAATSAPAETAAPASGVMEAGRTGTRISGRRGVWAAVAALLLVVGIIGTAMLVRAPASVLSERDTVLLADVTNATGDPVFDDALRLALAVNLEQAPFLRILPQEAVRSALVRAGRSPDERVVGPVALDVCRREGAAVLLAGSIAPLGSSYAVGVEAILCRTGESLGRAVTEADSRERVLSALEESASHIRRRLGESRESLGQHDVPLVQATTPSLEALRALSLGDVRRDRGRFGEALTHYRQATDLDPEFALAWARRGVTARNLGLRDEAIPALRRAFELRDRVSLPERFFIESLYYRLVEGDAQKAIETYQAWKRVYPGSPVPPNAIASTLSDELGQYEAAIEEAREAIGLAPHNSMPYSNLVQALVGAGRFAEAKQAVAEATSRGLDDPSMHAYSLTLALLEDDQAAIERETAWAAGDPDAALLALRLRATAAASVGRLADARQLWLEALAAAGTIGSAGRGADVRLERAEAEALVGDQRTARTLAAEALAADSRAFTSVRSAIVFALVGDPARARALLDGAARQAAADPAPLRVWLPVAEALVLVRSGRADEAMSMLQPVARFERGNDFGMVPLGVRALASLSAGRPTDAVAAFDDVIRLRALTPGAWVAVARLGRARALRDSGDATGSLAAYDEFLEAWNGADPDLPLLKTARDERVAVLAR